MPRRLSAVLAAAFASALLPAAATAATRYASPSGSAANPCSQSAPCDIATAVNGAGAADTILVAPGTYGSPGAPAASILNPAGTPGLKIEGEAMGAARPVLHLSGGDPNNAFLQPTALLVQGPGAIVSDLDVEGSAAEALEFAGGDSTTVAERVVAHAGDGNGCDVESGSATIRDSVCRTDGPVGEGPAAVTSRSDQTVPVVNVTAIAPHGYGLAALNSSASPALQAVNTIAEGGLADVWVLNATITLQNSAYNTTSTTSGTITDLGGQVTSTPSFVDSPDSDFHETYGSSTVDAGTASASTTGELDLDGEPRAAGTAPDIGAYEWSSASLDVTPGSLAFPGKQSRSTVSAPRTVTIRNVGGSAAPLSFTFGGANPGDFLLGTSTCAGSLPPTQVCTVAPRFAPRAEGPRAGQLAIGGDAAVSRTVALTGVGGPLPHGPPGKLRIYIVHKRVRSHRVRLRYVVTFGGTVTLQVAPQGENRFRVVKTRNVRAGTRRIAWNRVFDGSFREDGTFRLRLTIASGGRTASAATHVTLHPPPS